eukprot:6089477-Alexandrium_andersonii.AAC.1
MAYQPWGSRAKHRQLGQHVAAAPRPMARGCDGMPAQRSASAVPRQRGDTAQRASRWRRNRLMC